MILRLLREYDNSQRGPKMSAAQREKIIKWLMDPEEPLAQQEEETEQITCLLEEMREGDPRAAEELLPHVYRELRVLAASKMAHEAPDQTLQPTALVHEAWVRLGIGQGARFTSRAYFFAAAGEGMRRILVEAARRKKRLKHGGNRERVDIDNVQLVAPLPDDELLAVDEALNRLAESEPCAAELVKLLFFVGLTQEQAATELGISISTVERTWAFAKAWLFRDIQKSRNAPS
jgi:RNA polymerase sigma factor (TIGR02999 family)